MSTLPETVTPLMKPVRKLNSAAAGVAAHRNRLRPCCASLLQTFGLVLLLVGVMAPFGGVLQAAGSAFSATGALAFTAGNAQTSLVIPVLDNDTPAVGGTLSVMAVTQGAAGKVVINPDETVTYSPNVAYRGKDAFTYTVTDGLGNTATEAVTVKNGFAAAEGSYAGLITNGTAPTNASSGYLVATLGSGGQFSGKLLLAGFGYPVKGRFNTSWNCLLFINRPSQTAYAVLQLNPATLQITGTVSNGKFTSTVTANRLPYAARTSPAPQAGKFTVLLPPNPLTSGSAATYPQGEGYLSMTVTKGGSVTARGRLGDGTPVTVGGLLVAGSGFPLYTGLYRASAARRGSVLGIIFLSGTGQASDSCNGTLQWFKPEQLTGNYYYWTGFGTTTQAIGSRYIVPIKGMPALNLAGGQGTVTLSGGNLAASASRTITLSNFDKVAVTDVPPLRDTLKLALWITPSTGTFTGSFFDTSKSSLVKRAFSGVLLQNQSSGGGLFMGSNESGSVELTSGALPPVP